MYKVFNQKLWQPPCAISKLLLIMKLTTLILITGILQVSASTYAQRISLSERNVSLTAILDHISTQTGYDFLFDSVNLKNLNNLSVKAQNEELKEVLSRILAPRNLVFSIKNNTVIIKEAERSLLTKVSDFFAAVNVTGRVVDQADKPLPGITVSVTGSRKSVATDSEGRFQLNNVDEQATLQFSSVGYETQEIRLNGRTTLMVSMKQTSTALNEVVMVGYGSTRRKDLTGSIASVNVNEINNTPLVAIDQALAGKAMGVQVTQSDGSPGGVARIRIRGGASLLGGNDPLYIIDGVQVQVSNSYVSTGFEVQNPIAALGKISFAAGDDLYTGLRSNFGRGVNTLAGLNINDIESIDILKDASATAIYGSRAANGVVIITTKKGKKNEKPVLEANYYTALSKAISQKVLNADQYRQVFLEGSRNLNARLAANNQPADASASAYIADPSLLGTANTDWLDMVLRTGITQNADVSVRGGGSGSSYYMSLGYNKNKGTIVGTDFSRVAGKINLINELNEKLRLIANLDMGFTKNNITNGAYGAAILAPPTFAPYNADGSLQTFNTAVFAGSTATSSGIVNPLAMLQATNLSEGNTLLGSLSLEYDILKELKFRTTASINNSGNNQLNYQPSSVTVINQGGAGITQTNAGIGAQSQTRNRDMFYETNLTWDKQFNENHRLNVLGGSTWQKTTAKSFGANGQGYPDDFFLNGLSSAAVFLKPTASEAYSSMLSFYLRANYSFKERYLLTLTGRSDASSKFPKNTRVFYTPSFGVAWRIKEESFLKQVEWVDELKIRASAGYTGNQNLGNNLFYTLFTPASLAGSNALVMSQLGNDLLKPERTLQKDIGLDFSIFQGRLSGSAGYYQKHTKGVLLPSQIPGSSGFGSVYMNKASIDNKGLELELRGTIIRNNDFGWNLAFNISANRSRLGELNRLLPNANSLGSSDNPVNVGEAIGNTALIPGEPLGQIFGTVFTGLIRTQAELDAVRANPNAFPTFFGGTTASYYGIGSPVFTSYRDMYGASAGALGFAPARVRIGSGQPKFYGGMTHTFNYKKLSLTALFTYSYGGDLLYLPESNTFGLADMSNRITRVMLPYYTPENPGSNRPTLTLKEGNNYSGFSGTSTMSVFDASYIKLKTINISYTLPQAWVNKVGVTSGQIYFSGANLFAITKYPGPDPEVSNDPYSIQGGFTDDGAYPQSRQYSMGIRFSF